jgi:hypothetical protein
MVHYAREWALEKMLGYPVFNRLWDEVMKSRAWQDEDKLYKLLGRRNTSLVSCDYRHSQCHGY